uniref:Uncharacterized protein n=1 Tax=Lactuca sativa TaxID=4236 RepID=A0A9R1V4Q8_LACSA|nr:hypothetical protein LSAT_V11C600307850 [Lactuca sativa]
MNIKIILLVHIIHPEALTVTRKSLTICYWSLEKIRYRKIFEQEIGRFGLGELNGEFVNEKLEGDIDLEDNDCDKDEDDSIELIILNMLIIYDYTNLLC